MLSTYTPRIPNTQQTGLIMLFTTQSTHLWVAGIRFKRVSSNFVLNRFTDTNRIWDCLIFSTSMTRQTVEVYSLNTMEILHFYGFNYVKVGFCCFALSFLTEKNGVTNHL